MSDGAMTDAKPIPKAGRRPQHSSLEFSAKRLRSKIDEAHLSDADVERSVFGLYGIRIEMWRYATGRRIPHVLTACAIARAISKVAPCTVEDFLDGLDEEEGAA